MFDALVFDESKKLTEETLDIAATIMPVLQFLRKRGIYGFWPHDGKFQMDRDRFIATFPDYTVSTYPSDSGAPGRIATAEYMGVKFCALLDMEV